MEYDNYSIPQEILTEIINVLAQTRFLGEENANANEMDVQMERSGSGGTSIPSSRVFLSMTFGVDDFGRSGNVLNEVIERSFRESLNNFINGKGNCNGTKNSLEHLGKYKRINKSDPLILNVEGEEKDTCPICIETFVPGEYKRELYLCKHTFHKRCIDKWLSKRKLECPICRQDYTQQT